MKNKFLLVFSLCFVSLLFTACDPLKDDLDKISAAIALEKPSPEFSLSLSEDDYELSGNDNVSRYKNFSNTADAKTYIPAILTAKFPQFGKGALANVTYDLYNPFKRSAPTETYTVTSADYEAAGFNYGNFDDNGDIDTFLKWKFPNITSNKTVELSYKWYNGTTEELTKGMIYFTDTWYNPHVLVKDDYTALGRFSTYFSNHDDPRFKVGIYLKTLMPYAKAGDKQAVEYTYRWTNSDGDRQYDPYALLYTFDGTNWNLKAESVEKATLKLGRNATAWEPDNTIKYKLTPTDYAFVGNGNYNNFDVRAGNDEAPESARIAKIAQILTKNFPASAEGQKYEVSYDVYSGAAEVWTLVVILQNGSYVKFEG